MQFHNLKNNQDDPLTFLTTIDSLIFPRHVNMPLSSNQFQLRLVIEDP